MDPYTAMMMQLQGPQFQQQPFQPPQGQPQQAAPDNSQYMQQIQQLQTQLAELRSGQNQQRGLNVTYF